MLAKNCSTKMERQPVVDEPVKMLPPQTCAAIEELLLEKIDQFYGERTRNEQDRIQKANDYIVLSQKGCAENRNKYSALAVREIEIARALGADTYDIAFLYKGLGMMPEVLAIVSELKKLGHNIDDLERDFLR
jgi:hypothetical protein